VREAVRYARELETLAQVDAALVDVQAAIDSAARSYDEGSYKNAYDLWQNAWVRLTSPISDVELLDGVQVIGSLPLRGGAFGPHAASGATVVGAALGDECARGDRARHARRCVARCGIPRHRGAARAPGQGRLPGGPIAPLRERVAELGTPEFHS
jgi:hypothetical protein